MEKYKSNESGTITKVRHRSGAVIIEKEDGGEVVMPWSAIIGLTTKMNLIGQQVRIVRLVENNKVISGKIIN
jgi:hypothetical protein